MNDAKFNYGLFALKNGAEIDKSISALPDSKTKKEKAMPVAAVEPDEDEESISALPEDEDIIDEKELKRNRIKSLIKLAVIGASIIIIIIISTIAWFTMNRENETNGMSMTGTSLPFDIVTKGTAIRNESVLDEVRTEVVNGTARSVYSSGASGTFTDSSDNNTYTFYQADSLKLRFTPVDDPSTTDINEEENPPDIGPGSSAALSLFVVPNTDSAINVKITMNVVAFAEIQKMENGSLKYKKNDNNEFILDSNGNRIVDTEIVEIKNTADFAQRANAVGNSGIADKAADYVKAAAYLGNHILFFGGAASDPETSGYYFTDPITTGTVTRSIPANNKGKAVAVPIYWMWTNTFGQIALTGSVDGLRTGIPILLIPIRLIRQR